MSNRTQLLIRLTPELKQAITAKASSQGLPLNQWAVQVLAAALDCPDHTSDRLPDINALIARVEAIEARLALGTDIAPDIAPDSGTDIKPDIKTILSQLRKKLISPEDAVTLIPTPHPPGLRSLLGKVRNSRMSQSDALAAIQNYQD